MGIKRGFLWYFWGVLRRGLDVGEGVTYYNFRIAAPTGNRNHPRYGLSVSTSPILGLWVNQVARGIRNRCGTGNRTPETLTKVTRCNDRVTAPLRYINFLPFYTEKRLTFCRRSFKIDHVTPLQNGGYKM